MRKEVHLDEETVEILSFMASKHKWSVKKYMESVLTMHASRYRSKFLASNPQQTEKNQVR
jgi:predicted RNA-binding protein with PUA domain